MNFNGFDFDSETKTFFSELDQSKRMPHAIIVECPDSEKADNVALFLTMYALCESENKPCGVCKNCQNAKNKNHSDVQYLKLMPKKTLYQVDQIRDMIKDAVILPNDANAKVYVIPSCDKLFQSVAQNAFLKLSEEPPENVYFLLLCKNAQSLLETIRSRFTTVKIRGKETFDDETLAKARAIVDGILAGTEYPLMKALFVLTDAEADTSGVLPAVKVMLRDALAILSGGEAIADIETAKQLATRLTRKKLIEMIELCSSSELKIQQNVNINLLTTRMCGEFRRITWQR